MEDLDAVTERLRSAKEAHAREVKEQQRRTNDLQERLSETRTQKEQVRGMGGIHKTRCSTVTQGVVRLSRGVAGSTCPPVIFNLLLQNLPFHIFLLSLWPTLAVFRARSVLICILHQNSPF